MRFLAAWWPDPGLQNTLSAPRLPSATLREDGRRGRIIEEWRKNLIDDGPPRLYLKSLCLSPFFLFLLLFFDLSFLFFALSPRPAISRRCRATTLPVSPSLFNIGGVIPFQLHLSCSRCASPRPVAIAHVPLCRLFPGPLPPPAFRTPSSSARLATPLCRPSASPRSSCLLGALSASLPRGAKETFEKLVAGAFILLVLTNISTFETILKLDYTYTRNLL